jgi:phosphoglycolate phosphatase-like HAD superfamily hydrolase
MKKIIFFDGDGTLWYPKATKHSQKPHWVYYESSTKNDYLEHLVLIPGVVKTLRKLRKSGVLTVVVSTHPHFAKEADSILKEKVNYFGLEKLFDEVHAARNIRSGKGDVIIRVLKRLGLSKNLALMVGDSYKWDYLAAKKVGVDCVLMNTDYLKTNPGVGRVKSIINRLEDIIGFL